MIISHESETKSERRAVRSPEIDLCIVVVDEPELSYLFRDTDTKVSATVLTAGSALLRRQPYEFD